MMNADIIVVGGGPSGLRLAGALSRKGLRVRVLEKKERIGANIVCSGIVGKKSFEEFSLRTDSILHELQTVRLVSPGGRDLVYSHPSAFAYVVDREKFDRNLAVEALENGAEIETGCKVEDVRISGDGVSVETKNEGGSRTVHSAKMIVLASGIDFTLQKRLGLGRPQDFLNGAQAEFDSWENPETTLFVGKSVAPGAFAWTIPAGPSRIRIGLLSRRDSRAYLSELIARHYPDRSREADSGGIRVKAIAQGLLSKTFGERILSLGEAAGQVKTTTGGGIYYGMLCADIAAEVIRDCFDRNAFLASDLSRYEKVWKRAIEKEIVFGHVTRRLGAKLSDPQMEKIFHLARTDGLIPIIRERADFDWHSDLILALVRRLSFWKIFKSIPREMSGSDSMS